ncbi:MAG: hypothetical protein JNG86_20705 [Verrucomicrobiaceae bacterium]|nr:hypothetical protein [Verrucomicrobiaceae bacterium]
MTTTRIVFIIACLIVAAPAQQDGRTPEQRLEWERGGRLQRGDAGVVEEYYREKNLRMLWSIFLKADAGEYGLGRTSKETAELQSLAEKRSAMNAEIRERSREALESIPGHAKAFGDEVDALANVTGSQEVVERAQNRRHILIHSLGDLGSPECIQQIGRFLLDERSPIPDGWKPYTGTMVFAPIWGPSAPSNVAVFAMDSALGENSPWKPYRQGAGGFVNVTFELKKYLQDWWRSEESAKYRVRLPGVEPPPDPPPLEGPLVRPTYTPVPAPNPPQAPSGVEEESSVLWKEMLVLGVSLLAVLMLVTWLASRRRR